MYNLNKKPRCRQGRDVGKAEISTKPRYRQSRAIGKKSNCFAYRMRSFLLLKCLVSPIIGLAKCPICHKFAEYPTIRLRVMLPLFCLRWFGPCRVLYRVQLTRPPLTELNQCAFTSDSYLFYSPPDIWNALFRTFVLRTKSRSTSIFVSVAT